MDSILISLQPENFLLLFPHPHLLAGNLKVNGLERSLTVPLAKIKTKQNETTQHTKQGTWCARARAVIYIWLGASGLTDPSPGLTRAVLPYWVVPNPSPPNPRRGWEAERQAFGARVGVLDRVESCGKQGAVSWTGFGYKAVQGGSRCQLNPGVQCSGQL